MFDLEEETTKRIEKPESDEIRFYRYIWPVKYVLTGLLVVFLFFLYVGENVRDVSPREIKAAFAINEKGVAISTNNFEEIPSLGEFVKKGDAKALRKYYSISPDDVECFVLYTPTEVMEVEELLVIKAKDAHSMAELRKLVHNRLNSQKKNFEGYGTTQMDVLNHAKIESKDKYLLFVVSKRATAWGRVFDELLDADRRDMVDK